jgi:hypothetical protein
MIDRKKTQRNLKPLTSDAIVAYEKPPLENDKQENMGTEQGSRSFFRSASQRSGPRN